MYLRQCLDSILTQSFYSYEIILIDDDSTDNSVEICDVYNEKYNHIKINS